ncbi:hypothetical protein RGQ29_031277 [Quercus rubra]|uniref:Uncharacterized protein n=1 Tax=Quercus rubra TaxID=3512 RepID=A0AAN7EK79_QUERU|nr:hypothetical protein RGQ29_031277 [Quercus rubra]
MDPEASQEAQDYFFEYPSLEGSNVGAAMFMRSSPRGESHDSCCINIYVNNNVQGANNSTLYGSELRMRDPGVSLSFGDVKLSRRSQTINKIMYNDTLGIGLGFCLKFLSVIIILSLLLSLI